MIEDFRNGVGGVLERVRPGWRLCRDSFPGDASPFDKNVASEVTFIFKQSADPAQLRAELARIARRTRWQMRHEVLQAEGGAAVPVDIQACVAQHALFHLNALLRLEYHHKQVEAIDMAETMASMRADHRALVDACIMLGAK